MRRWLWIGMLALAVSGCAGPREPPTTADLIFPLPYLIKQQRDGASGQDRPSEVTPDHRP
jgi:hypothetical protein